MPSAASRQGAPNSTASSILNAFPAPNGALVYADQNFNDPNFGNYCTPASPNDPNCTATGGQFLTSGWSNPSTSNVWNIRLDQSFHDKYTFFARYNRGRGNSESRSTSDFADNSILGGNTDTLTIGTTQAITQRLANQFTINGSSQTNFNQGIQDTFGGAVPMDESLLIPSSRCSTCAGIVSLNGLTAAFSSTFTENIFGGASSSKNRQINGVDNLSWEVHGHQLKFGADYRYLSPVVNSAAYLGGAFFADLASVYSNSLEFGLASYTQPYALAVKSFSAYAQDSWKVTPRLVLTYGTRWEFDPAPTGKNGKTPLTVTSLNLNTTDFSYLTLAPLGTPIYHATYNNFAPRLGFSYVARSHAGSDTVLRGGGGIFYDTGQSGVGAISFPYDQSFSILPGTGITGYPVFSLPVAAAYAQAPPTNSTPAPATQPP